jgi:hypothetical protein
VGHVAEELAPRAPALGLSLGFGDALESLARRDPVPLGDQAMRTVRENSWNSGLRDMPTSPFRAVATSALP